MKNYIKAYIEEIDEKYIYLKSGKTFEYFFYLTSDNFEIYEKNKEHNFYIGSIKNEFENLEVVFKNKETRNMFMILTKIKTIGFKTTIYILNNFSVDEILKLVEDFDVEAISTLKKIGPYSARIIIDSLQKEYFQNKITDKKDKVVTSLAKLGFKQKDILKVINKIDNSMTVEQMTEKIIGEINA